MADAVNPATAPSVAAYGGNPPVVPESPPTAVTAPSLQPQGNFYQRLPGQIDQNQLGALQALATGGTAAHQAYMGGINAVQADKQSAVSGALQRANAINAGQAGQDLSGRIAAPYDRATTSMQSGDAATKAYLATRAGDVGSYMNEVKAAIPASELLTTQKIAAAQAKAAGTNKPDFNTILGGAKELQAQAAETALGQAKTQSAAEKKLLPVVQQKTQGVVAGASAKQDLLKRQKDLQKTINDASFKDDSNLTNSKKALSALAGGITNRKKSTSKSDVARAQKELETVDKQLYTIGKNTRANKATLADASKQVKAGRKTIQQPGELQDYFTQSADKLGVSQEKALGMLTTRAGSFQKANEASFDPAVVKAAKAVNIPTPTLGKIVADPAYQQAVQHASEFLDGKPDPNTGLPKTWEEITHVIDKQFPVSTHGHTNALLKQQLKGKFPTLKSLNSGVKDKVNLAKNIPNLSDKQKKALENNLGG